MKRISFTPDETYGALLRDDHFPICLTLENPWRMNQVGASCIPAGCWLALPYDAPTYGETWEIEVPGRSAILIHAGNHEGNTQGCILLGSKFGEREELDILASKPAVERFKTEQPWEPFWFDVVDP